MVPIILLLLFKYLYLDTTELHFIEIFLITTDQMAFRAVFYFDSSTNTWAADFEWNHNSHNELDVNILILYFSY